MKYKVGDKVKIIDELNGHMLNIGDVLTIKSIDYSDKCYEVDGWWVYDDEIELANDWTPNFGEKVFAYDKEENSEKYPFYYLGKTSDSRFIVCEYKPSEEYIKEIYIFKNVKEYKKELPEYTIYELKEKIGHDFKLKNYE